MADLRAAVIVMALTQPGNQFPGPNTWLMRRVFWRAVYKQPLDFDAEIAGHAAWLNKPEHAAERARLAACCELLVTLSAEYREAIDAWQLPDNPFDPSDWLARG